MFSEDALVMSEQLHELLGIICALKEAISLPKVR